MIRKQWPIFLGAIALATLGCGGGGSSSASNPVAFFITDDLNAGYDHVWVTIKQVSLEKVGGGNNVVFSDPAGVAVDLRSLRDAQGNRFKFLGCDDDLNGQYSSVTVTLDDEVILYPTNASTGQNRVFAGSAGGEKQLTANFPAQTFGAGNDDFVIDFDLSQWNDSGAEVTDAVIVVLNDDDDFDDIDQHDNEDFEGTLSDLSGVSPDQTFTVNEDGRSFAVLCTVDTEIQGSDDNGDAVLANGQEVEVEGVFDPVANRLVATRIEVEDDNNDGDDDEIEGDVSNINAELGTFDMSVEETDNFLPEANPIHVVTNANTQFRGEDCSVDTAAEFFAVLVSGDEVEVEGVYDPLTNTLTATEVKREGSDDNEGDD